MKLQLLLCFLCVVAVVSSFKLNNQVTLCNECMDFVKDLAGRDLEEGQCQERAQRMCDILELPELMNRKCQEHVMEKMSEFLNGIKSGKEPREICSNLRLCRAQ